MIYCVDSCPLFITMDTLFVVDGSQGREEVKHERCMNDEPLRWWERYTTTGNRHPVSENQFPQHIHPSSRRLASPRSKNTPH